MYKQKYNRLAVLAVLFLTFQIVNVLTTKAQESKQSPEMSVVGVELGNRESAKKYLLPGHAPRVEEDGRASYYFYNEWGTQVMRLTVASVDDPYFITEIEVFSVGESYQKKHYQDKEHGLMMTENGIFIGFRQSAMNLIVGVRNVGKANVIGPGEVIKIKGAPKERIKETETREVLTYKISGINLAEENMTADYEARYEFSKKKLRRFSLKINPDKEKTAKK